MDLNWNSFIMVDTDLSYKLEAEVIRIPLTMLFALTINISFRADGYCRRQV